MRPLEAVRAVATELEAARVPSPRVDAEILVSHVLAISRTAVYAGDRELDEADTRRLRSLVERRRMREPLAYILGEWGFRGLTLAVDRRVLVPRPETESVVERCLVHLRRLREPRVLDVGTGSGAIALAIADEHPGARVTGTDASRDALAVAEENVRRTGLGGRVRLVHGDLFAGLSGPFDLVVSNPPYVEPDEADALEPEVRVHEPREALLAGGQTEAIARGARGLLRPGGRLVLETASARAAETAGLLRSLGYEDVLTTPDLAGEDRTVEGRMP